MNLTPQNIKEIPEKLELEVQELENILLKYNSFDMIGNFIFSEVFQDPNNPTKNKGTHFVIEYLSLLYLKHPFSYGNDSLIDATVIEDIRSRIFGIFAKSNLMLMPKGESENEKRTGGLRFKQILEELFVRGPAYPHHAKEIYLKLHEPFKGWFQEKLGFSLGTVFKICDSVSELMNIKTGIFREKINTTFYDFWGDIKLFRNKKIISGNFPEHTIEKFAKLPKNKSYKDAKYYIYSSFFSKIGSDALVLTRDEISKYTGTSNNEIGSCLNFFSVEFQDVHSSFSVPEPVHLLKSKPVIKYDLKYFFPNPSLLFWAAHRKLEESITPETEGCIPDSGNVWKRYEKNRRIIVEKESIKMISDALETDKRYENIFYHYDVDGEKKRCELDGLILFDNRLFLIEAKAGTLSPSARRGGQKRITRDVKKLIADAHEQALRTKKYINSSEDDEIQFSLSDGTIFTINKKEFEEIFMVTVTLENLDVYTAMLHETAETGIFEEGELPWAVSLFDLRIITDFTDFPSQFTHYLRNRLILNDSKKIHTHDEIDWFGLYLQHGLHFEDNSNVEENSFMYFDSFSSFFDDWYYFELGIKKNKPKRPSLPLSEIQKQIIKELSKETEYRHSEAISMILDMSGPARQQLEKMIVCASEKTKIDGKNHDFFLISSGGNFGISFYSFPFLGEDEKRMADNHITLRKYAAKAKKWLGILHCPRYRGIVHGWLFLDEPWSFDDELEGLKSNLKYGELPINDK